MSKQREQPMDYLLAILETASMRAGAFLPNIAVIRRDESIAFIKEAYELGKKESRRAMRSEREGASNDDPGSPE